MKKLQKIFYCSSCGTTYHKWQGKCEGCESWNTIEEELVEKTSRAARGAHDILVPSPLIKENFDDKQERIEVGIDEFDRVLGGGIVRGSALLLGGEPGIGKSTLILQVLNKLADKMVCLYISGEESINQINARALRLKVNNKAILFTSDCNVENILSFLTLNPIDLLIIDSLQTLVSQDLGAASGSISQVKHSSFKIIEQAKKKNVTVIFIGHITKDGQIAGPKVLEHMVDAVFYFEPEKSSDIRIIRAHKNRFGATNEIGLFEMTQGGLFPIKNASSIFIDQEVQTNISGVTIFAGIEGTRPVLYEIQALVLPTFMPSPRRAVVGWDINRLSMVIALISARLNIKLQDKEVYLNVAGGARIDDPSVDLAVIAALLSAALNKPLPRDFVFAGEVSLSGVVREPKMQMNRIKEVASLGFKDYISRFKAEPGAMAGKLKHHDIRNIFDLIKFLNNYT